MQIQQKTINRLLSSLIIIAAIVVIAVSGGRVSAASDSAPMTFAQATQLKQKTQTPPPSRGPGALKSNTATVKVLCNGKTATACCEGIAFCGCLYSPMPKKGDEDKPLSCNSSPPKN